jgi:N-acyl-D-aspartate/D-glutamate deacylase
MTDASIVLRNATIVDGTGAPATRGDVAVVDGVIAEVGRVGTATGTEADLDGLALAPGFIDIHTHYDAQVLWDPRLSPSPWHGVTTVVMGNCGFGLAPASPANRELVLGILELVEDMAPEALAAGVRWEFRSFAEYLDAVERCAPAINVAAFVGHTPVRIEAMGPDALERPATHADLAAMGRVVADARAAGAWGLATSLAANHAGPGGRHVPSYVGGLDEVLVLVQAMGTGVVEVARGATPVEEIGRLALPGVTVSWSSLLTGRPGEGRSATELLAQTARFGDAVRPQVSCRPLAIQVALANPVSLAALGCMRRVLAAPVGERAALYADPGWRAQAHAEVGESWRPMWEQAVALLDGAEDRRSGVRVDQYARDRGLSPLDALIELSLERGLGTRFDIPVANLDEDELGRLLRDPQAILGLSDAGAHANQQCDASFATYLLGHWVREREVLTLEEAVWRLTGQPAEVYGFPRRGVIREGAVADLVAFDPGTVHAAPLERARDFPNGSSRLISRSQGIAHVWVAGHEIVRDGADRGGSPGAVLRRSTP